MTYSLTPNTSTITSSIDNVEQFLKLKSESGLTRFYSDGVNTKIMETTFDDKQIAIVEAYPSYDLRLKFNTENNCSLFVYGLTNLPEIYLSGRKGKPLKPFQTIFINKPLTGTLVIKPFQKSRFFILKIHNSEMQKLQLEQTEDEKQKADSLGDSIIYGGYNLTIGQDLEKILKSKYDNFVSSYNIQGQCLLLTYSILEQYKQDLRDLQKNKGSLRTSELNKIRLVYQQIVEKPDYPYSVDYLCELAGISANKLQEGFRLLYEHSVIETIRQIRLVRAEYLLRQGEMNVSEVVYAVGFTSRSYFSKIFKNKFYCSPKEYLANLKPNAIMA